MRNKAGSLITRMSSFVLTCCLASGMARAEINYLDMKGVHDLIKPEYQEELSPIWGLTMLKTRVLENRRFFGKYGPKNPAYPCMEHASQINRLLVANNDCPQDSTSELIQRLFPSQDGQNFVPNQIPNVDLVSELTPEVLGKILWRISQSQGKDLSQQENVHSLTNDLTEILFKEMNPQVYLNSKSKGDRDFLKKMEAKFAACQEEDPKKQELEQNIASFKEVLEKLRPSEADPTSTSYSGRSTPPRANAEGEGGSPRKPSSPQGKGKFEDFKALATLIVNALKEQGLKGQGMDRDYPPHTVEHSLLAFFWKKGEKKEDFLRLLSGMDKKVIRSPLVFTEGSSERTAFLDPKNRYKKSDYDHEAVLQTDPKALAELLVKNPETMAFYRMREILSRPLPPLLSYAQAKHSSLADKDVKTYPDCGETSLRNFFNIVLYDQKNGVFDPTHLRSLPSSHPELKIHPNLIQFYKDHPDPVGAVNQESRDQWSEQVVSMHGGVNYLKGKKDAPSCEINAGMDNMMNVIDRLLFHNSGPQLGSIAGRSEKLDLLCKLLSRKGFDLEWKYKGDPKALPDKDVTLHFSINGMPSFSWTFNSGHFNVQDLTPATGSWKEQVGQEVSKLVVQEGSAHSKSAEHWFSTSKELETRMKDPGLKKSFLESYAFSLPLSSNEEKINIFKSIVSGPRAQDLKRLALRIQQKLPLDDLNAQREIHAALADADYPFGDPTHLVGKPHQKFPYRRVSQEFIRDKFGEEAARRMGISWVREMPGYKMALGEPLVDDDGTERKLGFEAAKKACLDLNLPPKKRVQVESVFLEREEKLDQLRKKHEAKLKSGARDQLTAEEQDEFDRILSSHKIDGCYLPSREEWKVMEADFGKQEEKYIPQVLPKLSQRWFWSSSGYPSNPGSAFGFGGNNGSVYNYSRNSDYSVRCACAGAAAW